ncbi:Mitogen-activated protein kinase kinase kinase YODA [Apostasia shenzhenica]|uniref:Mitogen-activated protein kinase kinase kinase YODA n=1 Tax=Apostasia shenzhenica TaxID=1088818 RepID=A0A2I0B120_9ASPA|nr:Mitogen-activated protein kinase kinase kinase YODA [Apostasia shenzhenica]
MDWVKGAALGKGSFGSVNVAVRRSMPAELMAVKSAPLSSASVLRREEAIISDLQGCPHIIGCFGHQVSEEPSGEPRLYNLFLEYAGGGDIYGLIRSSGGLPEEAVRRHVRSILEGLRHIHARGYVHCDIKPQNILLVGGEAKIADFGLSNGEIRGTPLYMAPEALLRKEYEAPADIWALGCTAAEMFSGRRPWPETEVCAVIRRIGSSEEMPEIPPAMSAEGKDFLSRCFVKDPRERWTAEMLLSHPFVASSVFEDEAVAAGTGCGAGDPSPKSVLGYLFSPIPFTPEATSDTAKNDWGSVVFPGDTPAERVRLLATEERPYWASSLTEEEGWIALRVESTGATDGKDEEVLRPASSSIGGEANVELSLPPLMPCSRSVSKRRAVRGCFANSPIAGLFSAKKRKLGFD